MDEKELDKLGTETVTEAMNWMQEQQRREHFNEPSDRIMNEDRLTHAIDEMINDLNGRRRIRRLYEKILDLLTETASSAATAISDWCEAYAKSHYTTVEELSAEEKQQALLSSVMRLDNQGFSIDTAKRIRTSAISDQSKATKEQEATQCNETRA